MEEVNRNSGHGLGVASLILGIISFVVAFIPCIGILAFFTSITAIILGAIGLSQASRDGSPRGMMLGGLIVGIIAIFVTITQVVILAGLSSKADFIGKKVEDIVKDIEKDIKADFSGKDFKIIIEEGENKVEIQGSTSRKDKLNTLEELEGEKADSLELEQDTTGGQ